MAQPAQEVHSEAVGAIFNINTYIFMSISLKS